MSYRGQEELPSCENSAWATLISSGPLDISGVTPSDWCVVSWHQLGENWDKMFCPWGKSQKHLTASGPVYRCSCETLDRWFLGKASHILLFYHEEKQIHRYFFLHLFSLKWGTPKAGAIISWNEGCCVVGWCNQHLLTPTNLLRGEGGAWYCSSAAPVLHGLLLSEEAIWMWEPPAPHLVCR